jgi:hypothetical protein
MMDSRVRDRYILKGKLKLADVEKLDEALPDLSENCEWKDYDKEFADSREEAEASSEGAAPINTGFAAAPSNPGSLV